MAMLTPALLGILVFFAYPLVASVFFSFTRYDLVSPPEWIGLRNYEYLFTKDPKVWSAALNTLWFIVFLTPIKIVTALCVAGLLARAQRAAGFWRTVFYLPSLVPPVASGVASGKATVGSGTASMLGYPDGSLLTYTQWLYVRGFANYQLGYASALAVLRAGTRAPDAMAVICGSGTNCIGLRGDGARVTYPSLGMISGDWGGGFSLGEWALWFAARAEDGRGDPTALQEEIAGHFGLATILEVTEGIHRRRIARERLLDIVPMIFALADRGDAVAARIIEWQAEEIVTQAVTTISRLERTGRPIPVVIGGGVIASGNRRLLSLIEHGLADRAPSAELTVVSEPPIVGAALLALEGAGADRAALDAAAGALSGTASGSFPVGAGSVAPQTHDEQR